ncbi:hypothetical protein OIV83_004259 [Microbotryomycetes sp. JL201]|nr:hypothetical protein OIV83_004259 [Microbotryomycetes sp. JL201]
MPDHENKGDSVIFVAEQLVLASLGINIRYVCGVKDYDFEALREVVEEHGKDRFAIVFHGGGNFGDLYGREHELKLSVMNSFPHVRMHVFPQSIKFREDEQVQHTRNVLSALTHPRNSIAVRDDQSYDFARRHFDLPNLRIDKTPDIVFFMGERPELRDSLRPPTPKDILFFRRRDVEKSDWAWAGGAEKADFPKTFVQSLVQAVSRHKKSTLSFDAGDWIDWDLTDEERRGGHIQFRAWQRFMTGARWLSSADFIVLDRLHGHIVSLLLGIPHVAIDNSIGKLSDYYSTWTKDCPLATLVIPDPNRPQDTAKKVTDAYRHWVEQGHLQRTS